MRTDFLNKVEQTTFPGSSKNQKFQKTSWIKSIDQPKVKTAYRETATKIYEANQAKSQPSKFAVALQFFLDGFITGQRHHNY